jgi:hypothetical protein
VEVVCCQWGLSAAGLVAMPLIGVMFASGIGACFYSNY